MKTINLNISVEIDENLMNENKIDIEDIEKQLVFISDEVIDGFTLTRNAQNNIDDFYIRNVSIENREKSKNFLVLDTENVEVIGTTQTYEQAEKMIMENILEGVDEEDADAYVDEFEIIKL